MTVAHNQSFFTVAQRNDHGWLMTPAGEPFFSLGMNHVDSATLRYPENLHIWRDTYHNDQRKWIEQSLVPDHITAVTHANCETHQ